MRILGWTLLTVGTLVFARSAWLMANYSGNMSEMSKDRGYILLTVSTCVALFGAWLVVRRPSHL